MLEKHFETQSEPVRNLFDRFSTGSGDMKVWYLDLQSGKRLKSYDGHNGDVAGLSLKPKDEV